MSEEIIFREFRDQDYKPLEDIIRKTWKYDKFCSPKAAAKLAKAYLASCLANQTFTCVAAVNDVPVGIIMGKNTNRHRCPLRLRLHLLASIWSLVISKEGRAASRIFSAVNETDQELLRDSRKDYHGEVAFFAIDSKYRGRGLGKKLFDALLSYMKQENISEFYLFTDTSCNYPFYERQGMKRRCEKDLALGTEKQQSQMTFFLYEYSFI